MRVKHKIQQKTKKTQGKTKKIGWKNHFTLKTSFARENQNLDGFLNFIH